MRDDFGALADACVGAAVNFLLRDMHGQGKLALPDPDRPGRFLLLVKELPTGAALDDPGPDEGRAWHASPDVRPRRAAVAVMSLINHEGLPPDLRPRVIRKASCPTGASERLASRVILKGGFESDNTLIAAFCTFFLGF